MIRRPPSPTLFPSPPLFRSLARLLDLPLDVLCVRKVGTPGHPELAMGAVAPQGERYTNRRVASRLSLTQVDEAYDRADRKSTRLNSSHSQISYAVFCLKKKK